MTREENERLATVEERLENVCEDVREMRGEVALLATDVRAALTGKADKTEVDGIRRLVVGILLASAGFAITTLVALGIYVIQQFITRGM